MPRVIERAERISRPDGRILRKQDTIVRNLQQYIQMLELAPDAAIFMNGYHAEMWNAMKNADRTIRGMGQRIYLKDFVAQERSRQRRSLRWMRRAGN